MITNLVLIGLGCCIIIPLWVLIDKKDKWNLVCKSKPDFGQNVLVYCVPKYAFYNDILEYEIQVGYLESNNIWYLNDIKLSEIKEITHWKKLPKTPIQ